MELSPQQQVELFQWPAGIELHCQRHTFARDALRNYSVVSRSDPDYELVQKLLLSEEPMEDGSLDSCLGMLIGNVVGDALGAPLEFHAVQYGVTQLNDMGDENWGNSRFFLKPGQWTDDASMALCVADCLLVHGDLECRDLRLRFLNWWELGYNNAFCRDPDRRGGGSIGLGGNISMSFGEFRRVRGEFTTAGDEHVSGNGSVMRNGSVPCRYWDEPEKGMEVAYRQSKTTHQGHEAAECCRLMTFVCCTAAQRRKQGRNYTARDILACLDQFESPIYSVQCLAKSMNEEAHPSNAKLTLADRRWNWKIDNFRYSQTRAQQMPGYVGSYAMDAVAAALHCLWTTNSLRDAMIKVVNLRGDADSVGAVCGQMAGAIYGVSSVPKNWIRCIQQWDGGFTALRAYKLWKKQTVPVPTVEQLAEVSRLDTEFFASLVKVIKKE